MPDLDPLAVTLRVSDVDPLAVPDDGFAGTYAERIAHAPGDDADPFAFNDTVAALYDRLGQPHRDLIAYVLRGDLADTRRQRDDACRRAADLDLRALHIGNRIAYLERKPDGAGTQRLAPRAADTESYACRHGYHARCNPVGPDFRLACSCACHKPRTG